MRNLEYKETKNGIMTMGYQYRLLKPELVFHGQLRLFLDEISKSEAAGCLAVELAATAEMSCINVRVHTKDSPQTLYRLRKIACDDVCRAFEKAGIAWKKARFDDEGTVGAMPVRGYSYLTRTCRYHIGNENENCFFYAPMLEGDNSFNMEQIRHILTANPDSGISLQLIPAVLSREETMVLRTQKEMFKTNEAESAAAKACLKLWESRNSLFAFTLAIWGSGAAELGDCIAAASEEQLTEVSESIRGVTEYDDVTIDPWHLNRRLYETVSAPEQPLKRWACLMTREEAVCLLSEQNGAVSEELEIQENTKNQKEMQRFYEEQIKELREKLTDHKSRELRREELEYFAVESEAELGMTERQLETLKSAVYNIRTMGLFDGEIIDIDNYLQFTFMLGYLYELLMKECYHKAIYEPYCICCGKQYKEAHDTDLICYECGPGTGKSTAFSAKWSWKTMSTDMSRSVHFENDRWSAEQWQTFFKDMNGARRLRNKVHVLDRNGDVSFVSKEAAREGIELMLKGRESLMRRILLCAKAETSFEKKR